MKKLRLCFLWHMHQPYYKDDMDGLYHMPWVYLHALKDYFELPCYHRKYPGIRGTYNLVPSLLLQLKDYEWPDAEDIFLRLLRKDVRSLTDDEKNILIPQLFMANYKNQAKPLKRYRQLYDRKGDIPLFQTAGIKFSEEDILDLEVLYLLSWCGVFTFEQVPLAASLRDKGFGFTEQEKLDLTDELAKFIRKIVPLYRSLQDSGSIEVSATPFYHPILPVLIDPKCAREALPDVSMPSINTDFSAHAERHVSSAVRYYAETFGRHPAGMWPAEGSISSDAAAMFCRSGLRWIASDEDVLAASEGMDLRDEKNRHLLYQRHVFNTPDGAINIFFRDKELSDLFGFTYSGWDAEKAVDDFMERLSAIHDLCDFSPIVPVILDGENAWEYYPENASKFFNCLYTRLSACNWVETCTMSAAADSDTPEHNVSRIRAGSWIYASFSTWLGHPEKNEAWRVLSDAHARYMKNINNLENREKVEKELMTAEGSDWFWWYGDDHFSLQSDVFDTLFRKHIANIYTLMDEKVPAEISRSIKKSHKTGLLKAPACAISPVIDGHVSSFFEWLGAGRFDLKFDAGAMTASSNVLSKLYFGYDSDNLYLRVDGDIKNLLNAGYVIETEITSDTTKIAEYPITHRAVQAGAVSACRDIFEVSVDRNGFGSGKIYLTFRLKKDGRVIETAPLYNTVEIDLSRDMTEDWIA